MGIGDGHGREALTVCGWGGGRGAGKSEAGLAGGRQRGHGADAGSSTHSRGHGSVLDFGCRLQP